MSNANKSNKPKKGRQDQSLKYASDNGQMLEVKTSESKGKPSIVFTAEQKRQIETMAGYGMTLQQISSIIGVHYNTILNIQKRDPDVAELLKRGRAKAVAAVSQTAFQLAKTGKNPTMTMFWLKTQAKWREIHPAEENKPAGIVFKTKIGDKGQIFSEQTEQKQKNEEELPDL